MSRLSLLLALRLAAGDAPLAIEVRSGTFQPMDGGLVDVEPTPDGGSMGAYLNEPMLMQTGKRLAGCEAAEAVYADAGEEPDRAWVISAASAVIVGLGLGYAAGRLAKR